MRWPPTWPTTISPPGPAERRSQHMPPIRARSYPVVRLWTSGSSSSLASSGMPRFPDRIGGVDGCSSRRRSSSGRVGPTGFTIVSAIGSVTERLVEGAAGAMRLHVVGSSGTFPAPGRPAAGYVVQQGETRVWCDAGPGTFMIASVRIHPDRRRSGLASASGPLLRPHGGVSRLDIQSDAEGAGSPLCPPVGMGSIGGVRRSGAALLRLPTRLDRGRRHHSVTSR